MHLRVNRDKNGFVDTLHINELRYIEVSVFLVYYAAEFVCLNRIFH